MYMEGLKGHETYEQHLQKRRYIISGGICIWFVISILLGYAAMLYMWDLGFIESKKIYEKEVIRDIYQETVQTLIVKDDTTLQITDKVTADMIIEEVPQEVTEDMMEGAENTIGVGEDSNVIVEQTDSKVMYLTFDDGPRAEYTELILDVLKGKNVKATFFVIGENVRKYPETAKRIVEEGHAIGIHCDNHAYDTLYQSVDSFVADFEAAYETIYDITGVETKIFRFPGGSINAYNKKVYEEIITEMTNRGFVYFDWNASLGDTAKNNTCEQLLKNAKDTTLGRKKIIMLAHDTEFLTAQCLEQLIEQFPEYTMEVLTEDVKPIQF